MPTRLIHVEIADGKYSVRLITGISPRPYVTLSHCWGPKFPSHAKTTALNIGSRLSPSAIAWTELPQSFRDAVAMTERLGFEYIWIDALCIIQGSSADWQTESSLMHQVYSHCDLMLSADASSDTNEEQLARRIVHFSIDEVSYDCLGGVECHCGEWGPEGVTLLYNIWCKTLSDKICTEEFKHNWWRNTVERYGERQLSFWSDRFPALSALARQFQVSDKIGSGRLLVGRYKERMFNEIDMGTYLAGFWSNFLQADLLWCADCKSGVRVSTASNYVAPTWSWASVSGGVGWPTDGNGGTKGDSLAEILSVHCSPAGADKLGMITSAELVLRAKTTPVYLTKEFFHLSHSKYWNITLKSPCPAISKPASLSPFRPDCIQPTPEAKFWGGTITRSRDSREKIIPVNDAEYLAVRMGALAIIIVRVVEAGEPLVCERVGTVHRSYRENNGINRWFDGAKSQVLKII
ncbi:hypothetical protein NW759_012919 [Fusarium solani]|nr:hypothetical protein NW759_012919 [Fusarium solani]